MSDIAVRSMNPAEGSSQGFLDQMEEVLSQVRQRAFQLFEERHGDGDHALSDWFAAERELLKVPSTEMSESDEEIHIRAAVPGLNAEQVKVDALPDSIIIEGEATQSKEEEKEKVLFSEFKGQRLFRRLDLPAEIDPEKVTATLDNGMLEVVAKKALKDVAKAASTS
jgi:HSP20 family molecular chaperone IbpA